jgi:PAS domain S-box-containing protein
MATPAQLKRELAELKTRLAEAEDTLDAIRRGEVDGLVASGPEGDQVFTLKGAEMPYRMLVEEMNQGALMLIPDGTIFYANSRFADLSKTPLEQVIGSCWEKFFLPEKHEILATFLRAVEPVRPHEDLRLLASDGSTCPVHLAMYSTRSSGVDGFSVMVTDLAERRQGEDELRKISDALLEKNKELEAFSYSISHDMRAPLRTMQGFSKILLDDYSDKLDEEAITYLDRIIAASVQLDQLIRDVLAYSQLTCEHKDNSTFDLDSLIRGMIHDFPNLSQANIEIISTTALVRGHEVGIKQCLSNLLGNAIKFVPKNREPHIKVWSESKPGWVRLWVEDNGIGIRPENFSSIFDIFSRVNSRDQFEGTGIGLSMVKKAVLKMGGRVGVESIFGSGSRFWIELESATLPLQGSIDINR